MLVLSLTSNHNLYSMAYSATANLNSIVDQNTVVPTRPIEANQVNENIEFPDIPKWMQKTLYGSLVFFAPFYLAINTVLAAPILPNVAAIDLKRTDFEKEILHLLIEECINDSCRFTFEQTDPNNNKPLSSILRTYPKYESIWLGTFGLSSMENLDPATTLNIGNRNCLYFNGNVQCILESSFAFPAERLTKGQVISFPKELIEKRIQSTGANLVFQKVKFVDQ